MSKKRVQITLSEQQHEFMIENMKKKNISKSTHYFQNLIDEQRNKSAQGIEHILYNTRETNKLVKVLLEIANYQLRGNEQFIPSTIKKSDVLVEATQAVKAELARMREIKLSKKSNI